MQKRPPRADKLKNVAIERVQRGRFQPRRAIDGVALKELTESVREAGIIQPLLVRKAPRGRFEIVAGERRWLAAKTAGLRKVPVVVRNVSDATALALSLIENLQREDLNPIDQAHAIRQLIEDFSMTHQEVADVIGRSRATVSNLLRLLDLPADVKTMLADGKLDAGHARALLALEAERRSAAAEEVVASGLSVRDVEQMAQPTPCAPHSLLARDEQDMKWLPRWLKMRAGDGIRIKPRRGGGWCLDISFHDLDELRGALATLDEAMQSLEHAERLRHRAS